MKFLVAESGPFGHLLCQGAGRFEQVRPRHPGAVQDLHQNLTGDLLEHTDGSLTYVVACVILDGFVEERRGC